jgi:hypothetical protein
MLAGPLEALQRVLTRGQAAGCAARLLPARGLARAAHRRPGAPSPARAAHFSAASDAATMADGNGSAAAGEVDALRKQVEALKVRRPPYV